jgi:hypothetical protein
MPATSRSVSANPAPSPRRRGGCRGRTAAAPRRARASPRSRQEIIDRLLLPALAPSSSVLRRCSRKMSAGLSSQPSERIRLNGLLAQPLDIERARLTKCLSRSVRCAGQISPPVQRTSTSPSSATASLRIPGNDRGRCRASRASSRVRFSTTCGITSPARWITTRSPTRTPSRAISSRLCSVTLETVTTAAHGDRLQRPTGVSLPVRPT